jgi:hypothetical protein
MRVLQLHVFAVLGFLVIYSQSVCIADQLGSYTFTLSDGQATITSFNENYSGSLLMTNELKGCPVARIGPRAFNDCKGLTSLLMPDSVTSIGELAFRGCKGLTNISIPDSVTRIELGAFFKCYSLVNVTIGAGVSSIGHSAFGYCFGLTNIEVSTGNKNYSSLGGVLFNKSQTILITFPAGKAGAYVIPDNVISIGENAFLACLGLSSIRMPDTVVSIEREAFSGCEGLTNVMIGAGVTNIGTHAFTSCDNLRSIYFKGSVPTCKATSFNDCTNVTLYYLFSNTNGWTNPFAGRPTKYWSPSQQ